MGGGFSGGGGGGLEAVAEALVNKGLIPLYPLYGQEFFRQAKKLNSFLNTPVVGGVRSDDGWEQHAKSSSRLPRP